jgi:hypothetical protein
MSCAAPQGMRLAGRNRPYLTAGVADATSNSKVNSAVEAQCAHTGPCNECFWAVYHIVPNRSRDSDKTRYFREATHTFPHNFLSSGAAKLSPEL